MTESNRKPPISRRQGVDAALRRAALEARKLAEQAKCPLFVLRGGQIVDLCRKNPSPSEPTAN